MILVKIVCYQGLALCVFSSLNRARLPYAKLANFSHNRSGSCYIMNSSWSRPRLLKRQSHAIGYQDPTLFELTHRLCSSKRLFCFCCHVPLGFGPVRKSKSYPSSILTTAVLQDKDQRREHIQRFANSHHNYISFQDGPTRALEQGAATLARQYIR